MLHVASIGLSCLLLFGTLTAPCSIRMDRADENEVSYQDSPLYFDGEASPLATTEVVRIDYISKQKSKYDLALRHPCYSFSPAVSSCAPIGGSNVLGYFDRFDEDLIPDHVSGTQYGSAYLYRSEDSAVYAVIRKLYDYMGTDANGTTEAEFLDGLKRYCQEKGKSVSTYSCMSSGSFSFSLAKSYIENSNLPIVFFLGGYNVGYMSEAENYDSIAYSISTANHVMVGFGYSIHSYVTADGNSTDYYFAVASGLAANTSGVYNINYKTRINDALAINIY